MVLGHSGRRSDRIQHHRAESLGRDLRSDVVHECAHRRLRAGQVLELSLGPPNGEDLQVQPEVVASGVDGRTPRRPS